MTLGENIYRLRTAHNLSQGDLADQLNVSRQSISKWETNSSTPDLDKLIKLSQIFHMTLDDLVLRSTVSADPESTSEMTEPSSEPTASQQTAIPPSTDTPRESSFPPRKIAGTILLCMAFILFLVAIIMSQPSTFLFALPFIACAIVCFICHSNIGLWCCWAVYLPISMIIKMVGTRATPTLQDSIRHLIHGEYNMGTLFLLLQFLCTISLIAVTALRFRKLPVKAAKRSLILTGSGLTALTLLMVLTACFSLSKHASHSLSLISFQLLEAGWTALLTVLITLIVRIHYQRRHENHTH